MTAAKRIAVGTGAAGVAACAVCCAAPVAAVAAGAVFAPVAGVAGVTALAITVAQRRRDDDSSEGSVHMSSGTNDARGLRTLLAAFLVIAAVLFVVGVARERSLHHSETKPAAASTGPVHNESCDADSHLGEGTSPNSATDAHSETKEGRVLGVDLESWLLVVAFAAASLGPAIVLLRSRSRTVVAVIAIVTGVAAVFDIAEIAHRANESHTSLVVVASTVTALHLAAFALALLLLRAETPSKFDDGARTIPAI